jgi:serine/threonine protein kinase
MSLGSPAFKPSVLSLAEIPEHELVCPIASGAYGQVWLARNRLGVHRAVKIVRRASFDHDRPFEREFAGIKAFEPVSRSHEGLVDLLQVGRDDEAGYFYYVMELADNLNAECKAQNAGCTPVLQDPSAYAPRTLASEVKRRGRLPVEECTGIGLRLTEALAHLHGQGLVHRDIKPSNIIFVGGEPKLADVGLVVPMADARSFVGTEGFIPPEGPGTPQADIYSLGIVLYVLSTGKSHQDFPEPPADLLTQTNQGEWLEFDAVVHGACQAKVKERYRSAREMQEDLTLLQRGQSVKMKQAAARRWGIVKKFGLAAAGLALLTASAPLLKPAKHAYQPKPEVSRLYETGQWYYNQLGAENHRKAFEYLNQAIQADTKFIEPFGELTMLYVWQGVPGLHTDEERWQGTRAIADKVLGIDPRLAQGHLALSYSHFLKRDWRGAEVEILQAIKLNPKLPIPHYLYCYYLAMQQRTEEAQREGQQAELLESPAGYRVAAIVAAWPFITERRFDLAITQLRKALDLDRNFVMGYGFLGKCYEAQGNYVAALDVWNTGDVIDGEDTPEKVTAAFNEVRQAYATSGVQGYCRRFVELIHGDPAHPEAKKIFDEYELPGYYALLGDKAKALDELEKHFDEPNVWPRIKFEPLYDSLHNEPRYKELVRRAGLAP